MWPPDEDLLAAWRRLLADPTAAGRFAQLVLPLLEADLARQFPRADPHHVGEAADVAVAALLRRPAAFDPARGRLAGFLRMAARRDLINLTRAENRHRRGRIPWEDVELSHPAGNELDEAASLVDDPAIRAVVESLPEVDRRLLELMLDGERDSAVFAEALGVADWPAEEQAAEVKRAKDRLKARLKRAGGRG